MYSGCCRCRQPPGGHTKLHRQFGLPGTGLFSQRNSSGQRAHKATQSLDADLLVVLGSLARSTCPGGSPGLRDETAGWCRRPNPVSGLESSAILARRQSRLCQQTTKTFTLSIPANPWHSLRAPTIMWGSLSLGFCEGSMFLSFAVLILGILGALLSFVAAVPFLPAVSSRHRRNQSVPVVRGALLSLLPVAVFISGCGGGGGSNSGGGGGKQNTAPVASLSATSYTFGVENVGTAGRRSPSPSRIPARARSPSPASP